MSNNDQTRRTYTSSRNNNQAPQIPGQILHQNTFELYNAVIENVIKNIQQDFYDDNLDDDAIDFLRTTWIDKLNISQVLAQPKPHIKELKTTSHGLSNKVEINKITEKVKQLSPETTKPVENQPQQQQQQQQEEQQTNPVTIQEIPMDININTNRPPPSKQARYHNDGPCSFSDSDQESEVEPEESSSSSESEKEELEAESSTTEESEDDKVVEKPLGSDDDLEDDAESLFDCKDSILCQYDSVKRNGNKRGKTATWSLKFVSGVMYVRDRDYIFNKCTGEVNW